VDGPKSMTQILEESTASLQNANQMNGGTIIFISNHLSESFNAILEKNNVGAILLIYKYNHDNYLQQQL
jgi:hypothetical protein